MGWTKGLYVALVLLFFIFVFWLLWMIIYRRKSCSCGKASCKTCSTNKSSSCSCGKSSCKTCSSSSSSSCQCGKSSCKTCGGKKSHKKDKKKKKTNKKHKRQHSSLRTGASGSASAVSANGPVPPRRAAGRRSNRGSTGAGTSGASAAFTAATASAAAASATAAAPASSGQSDGHYQLIDCPLRPLSDRTQDANEGPRANLVDESQQTEGASVNWAGYWASASKQPVKGSVDGVSGSFAVPLLTPPADGSASYCTLSVSIDGAANDTVQQLSVECDWDPTTGQQVNYVLLQMYPTTPMEIVGFPCDAGDQITISVVVKNARTGQFTLTIANSTKDVYFVVPEKYTRNKTAQCATAQFLVEAPVSRSVLPLAHFGRVLFTDCLVRIKGETAALGSGKWQVTPLFIDGSAMPTSISADGKSFAIDRS